MESPTPRDLELARLTLAEDLGPDGDITSTSLGLGDRTCVGRILAKQNGVIAGLRMVHAVAAKADLRLALRSLVQDGDTVQPGTVIMEIEGPHRSLLIAERSALNFLQRLSGIASLTRKFVDAVSGTKARIYDTRKTTPTLRELEKQAVKAGGGCNHRFGLFDQILIKENHIEAFKKANGLTGSLPEIVGKTVAEAVRNRPSGIKLQVEVEDCQSAEHAARAGADLILLDNFSVPELREGVERVRAAAPNAPPGLEASGGITLATVGKVARTGVDRISVGALTHSAPSLDVSLLLNPIG